MSDAERMIERYAKAGRNFDREIMESLDDIARLLGIHPLPYAAHPHLARVVESGLGPRYLAERLESTLARHGLLR